MIVKKYLIVIIFLLAVSVRFYDYPNRVIFWSEQARSLITSANYVDEKFSLLGQEYFRQDSNFHTMFSGAIFNYLLVPLLYITKFDPLGITFFFTLLNLFTGFMVYWVAKKIFNQKIAINSLILFLFNSYMIYHSRFIWNYNLLPLVGVIAFYLAYLFLKKQKFQSLFWLGLVCGFGVSLQVLFTPILVGVCAFVILNSKQKVLTGLIFAIGSIVGNLPMVLFDLRHDFYHFRTLSQYLLDSLAGKSDAGFSYYYLLPFWGVGAIFLGKFVFKFNKIILTLFIILYLFINLSPNGGLQSKILIQRPILTVRDLNEISNVISLDAPKSFNVASTLDFDKRAYALRYLLKYRYSKEIEPIDFYPSAQTLFVLSEKDYNFDESGVWEIKSNWPYQVYKLQDISNKYVLYKLTK